MNDPGDVLATIQRAIFEAPRLHSATAVLIIESVPPEARRQGLVGRTSLGITRRLGR